MNTIAMRKLKKFGNVLLCKVVNNTVLQIVIVNNFAQNSPQTFDLITECSEQFPDFPIVETFISEDNISIINLLKYKNEFKTN